MSYTVSRVFFAVLSLCLARGTLAQCTQVVLPSEGFPGAFGTVFAAVPWDPDGAGPSPLQTAVVGDFRYAGDAECRHVARYDHTAGTWSPVGTGTDGFVRCAVAMPNGDLFVGGEFSSAGGVPCAHIARWDGQSWSALGVGTDGDVEALMAMPNGDLLVGGRFTNAGGIHTPCVARWDGAAWSAMPGGTIAPSVGFTTRVTSFATLANGDLVIGGWFVKIGAATIVGLARWDGATWSGFGGGLNSGVESLAVLPGGDLVVGGSFGTAGGVSAPGLARWNGSTWSPYGGGLRSGSAIGTVRGLAPQPNGDLIVAGDFETAGGVPASMVARWDGSAWHALGGGVQPVSPAQPGFASCLLNLPDGRVLLGGNFERVGDTVSLGLVAWNGARWGRSSAGCDGRVRRLAVAPGGELYAAGAFRTIGRAEARGVARWDGAQWSSLGFASPLDVHALAVLSNGDVVVGGQAPQGQATVNVVRWDGATWHDLPGLVGAVRTLHVDRSGRLLAGGEIPGGIARWNGSGWVPLGGGVANGQLPADVREMVDLANGDLVVSGTFTSAGSAVAARFARWDGSLWHGMAASSATEPADSMCVLPDGRLVALGKFTFGSLVARLAQWDGVSWSPLGLYGPAPAASGALALLPAGDLLMPDYSNAFTQPSLLRFDGLAWHLVEHVVGAVDALAVLPDGTVAVGGAFLECGDRVSPRIARIASTCPATATDLGGGCAGGHGAPALTATHLPWTGAAFEARGTGLAPASLAAAVYGFAPASTPLGALLPQAAAGCTLRATGDFVDLLVGSNGVVTTSLPIPPAASLFGVDVHHQLLTFELDTNGALVEVVASNALRAGIGTW